MAPTRGTSSHGLLVGAEAPAAKARFGFGPAGVAADMSPQLLRADPAHHGVIFASTGAGKFVNWVAPNCLDAPGPLIVVDPKGECAAVTARARAERGPVFVIDPFRRTGMSPSSINPMMQSLIPGEAIETVAESIAADLVSGLKKDTDPYWHQSAQSFLSGLIVWVATHRIKRRRHFGTVMELVNTSAEDLSSKIANGAPHSEFALRRVKAFLNIPGRPQAGTREAVLSFARQAMAVFETPGALKAVSGDSPVDFRNVLAGTQAFTIYIVFPTNRVDSHGPLLRVLVNSLLTCLGNRPHIPHIPTRFIIDEAANLGPGRLPNMYAVLRSAGVQMLTAWQSLGQMQDLYPQQYRSIIENAGVIAAFGCHATAARTIAELLSVDRSVVTGLDREEQLVLISGDRPSVIDRVDYRTHAYFEQMPIDPNPIYQASVQEIDV